MRVAVSSQDFLLPSSGRCVFYRPLNAKTHSSEKVFLRKKQGQRHTYPALSHKTLFFCRNLHPPETVSRVAFCFIPLFFKLRHTVDWEMSSSPDIRWVEVVGSWRSSSRTAVVLSSPDTDSGLPLRGRLFDRFHVSSSFFQSCIVVLGGAGLLKRSSNLRRLNSMDSFSNDIIHVVIVIFSLGVYSIILKLVVWLVLQWRWT